jgi:hypothetical protein
MLLMPMIYIQRRCLLMAGRNGGVAWVEFHTWAVYIEYREVSNGYTEASLTSSYFQLVPEMMLLHSSHAMMLGRYSHKITLMDCSNAWPLSSRM